MAVKYPYFKITRMDGGILRTWGSDTKFRTLDEAEKGVTRRIESMSYISKKNAYPTNQIVILKYTGGYQSKIVEIIDCTSNTITQLF